MQNLVKIYMMLMFITCMTSIMTLSIMSSLSYDVNAQLFSLSDRRHTTLVIDAPISTSGDNVYVAWWTNKSGNNEVLFRASNDNGATFGDKINLSNTPNSDSENVEIQASDSNVYITWWERNQTTNDPVMRISNDNGETFGPMLTLATNGTLTSNAEYSN